MVPALFKQVLTNERLICKALVRSKNLAALALTLSRKICAHAPDDGGFVVPLGLLCPVKFILIDLLQ